VKRLTVIVKGWPRLSETFVAQELVGLEALGVDIDLWSLRHPTDARRHALHLQLKARVRYLPEYLWHEPGRVARGIAAAIRRPGWRAAIAAFLDDWRPNRARRFGQACVLAAEMDPATAHLYAHFIHTPGSVARYAAMLCGIGWSASAHAKDIWTTPAWDKTEKLADMAWCATCTAAGAAHLNALVPGKTHLVYHGLDLARWPAPAEARPARDGTHAHDPVRIVSVGRLVAKKGYDDLIAALGRLDKGTAWRLVHIGGGPLEKSLRAQAEAAGIADRIDWRGAQDQTAVRATLATGDLFVLASRVAADGDRDGLPNVLMEAASQGLALVATDVAAIPEFVTSDCGVLVPPGDPASLAAALRALVRDPAARARLGAAARGRVQQHFPFARGREALYQLLRPCLSPPTPL
jgi:glycosyltransferase involved in cell wall biosynthesis